MLVCLDSGHFGHYNQSPTVKDFYESVFNWKMTNYMKEYFKEYGVNVITTRNNLNSDLSLYSRGIQAKDCDIFLSIHANACDSYAVDYPVVIRGFNEDSTNNLALRLAKFIAKTMGTKQQGRTYTRKRNNSNTEYYGVLRGAQIVNCKYRYIIEHSFYTNKAAALFLSDDDNIKKLAKGEVEIITEYFNIKKNTDNSLHDKKHLLRVIVEELNLRKVADWNVKACKVVGYGDVFTVVEEVKAANGKQGMFKLKNGLYITNSKRYVEEFYQ